VIVAVFGWAVMILWLTIACPESGCFD